MKKCDSKNLFTEKCSITAGFVVYIQYTSFKDNQDKENL